jgi:hypothetical protein
MLALTREACPRTSDGSLWATVRPSVDEDAASVRRPFLVHLGKTGKEVVGLVGNGAVEPQPHELAVCKHPCLVERGPRGLPFVS